MLAELEIYAIPVNMEDRYIHESHTVHYVLYHIIFCTKRRKKVLEGAVHDQLKELIEQVVEENHW
jgi:putative transposase